MVSMLASQNSGTKFSPRSDRNTCSVQCDWWGLLGLIKWMPASHHHSPILQTEGMSLIKQIEAFQLKYYWTVLRIPWTMLMIRSGEHWRTATGSYTATLPRQHWISTALWNICSLVEGVIPTKRGGASWHGGERSTLKTPILGHVGSWGRGKWTCSQPVQSCDRTVVRPTFCKGPASWCMEGIARDQVWESLVSDSSGPMFASFGDERHGVKNSRKKKAATRKKKKKTTMKKKMTMKKKTTMKKKMTKKKKRRRRRRRRRKRRRRIRKFARPIVWLEYSTSRGGQDSNFKLVNTMPGLYQFRDLICPRYSNSSTACRPTRFWDLIIMRSISRTLQTHTTQVEAHPHPSLLHILVR